MTGNTTSDLITAKQGQGLARKLAIPLALLCLALSCATAAAAPRLSLTNEDARVMATMFRAYFARYSERPNNDPAVQQLNREFGASPRRGSGETFGDPVKTYHALAKGLGIMAMGSWDEQRELAALIDMRLPAKLAEPGQLLQVRIGPLYERSAPPSGEYLVRVGLEGPTGQAIGKGVELPYRALEDKDVALKIPDSAGDGLYRVTYALEVVEGEKKIPLISVKRDLFILSNLDQRLERLAKQQEQFGKAARKSPRHHLAATTIDWIIPKYRSASEARYAGPPTLILSFRRGRTAPEPLNYVSDLALAEELAAALQAGQDPFQERAGDMHLAYLSPSTKDLLPLRLYVPSRFDRAKTYPLVVGLHGASSNENSFMDFYPGLFKKYAEERGYIALAPIGPGPFGGYWDVGGQEVMDALDLVQKIYPINRKRIYLTGHSMGGGGTMFLGFNHAKRFAALAPVAGFFGQNAQLAKAKQMPLLIAQAQQDRVVTVNNARELHRAAQALKMPNVKYIELEGVGHIQIMASVMKDVFDWFDIHSKN